MRLIDADALRKELRKKNLPISGADVYFVRKLIDNAPTVEGEIEILTKEAYSDLCLRASRERPKGEWTEHYDSSDGFTWLTCSRCMFKAYEDDYNFCPNCGAEMKGGAKND